MNKTTIALIIKLLKKKYSQVRCALNFMSNFELLVATILSAQCTDVRVNIVTKSLFKKYTTVNDFARADQAIFEQDIRSTGFYRNKTKNIIKTAQRIMKEYNGKVPDTMEALLSLPGVARKTANIVLYHGFGKSEGVAVDTHVRRLSQRLGLTKHDVPEKIEIDLMKIVLRKDWGRVSDLLIAHGRALCTARSPKCLECFLSAVCPSKKLFYSLKKKK
jgi:endonuclease III